MTNTSPSIVAENLGKRYKVFQNDAYKVKQLLLGFRKQYYHEYWALKNISLELKSGQSLGIIGRNGSGKSTLLQILCGTMRPTTGSVNLTGRCGALLELGSGFDPEFTGVENIYMNASLLGLSKSEIQDRIENIISFADIGDFVFEKTKKYSSGMVVRLAFAVLANIDADILVIDEALAVGDFYFNQKCMRYIQRYRREHTLVFVSHDLTAMASVCDRVLWLENGCMVQFGDAKEVLERYVNRESARHNQCSYDLEMNDNKSLIANEVNSMEDRSKIASYTAGDTAIKEYYDFRATSRLDSKYRNDLEICKLDQRIIDRESYGTGDAYISSVTIQGEASLFTEVANASVVSGGSKVRLLIEVTVSKILVDPIVGFILKNEMGLALFGDNTYNTHKHYHPISVLTGTRIRAEFEFIMPFLPTGCYSVTASVASGTQEEHAIIHWLNDALILQCNNSPVSAGLAGVTMLAIDLKL